MARVCDQNKISQDQRSFPGFVSKQKPKSATTTVLCIAWHVAFGQHRGFAKRENQIDAMERTVERFDRYLASGRRFAKMVRLHCSPAPEK